MCAEKDQLDEMLHDAFRAAYEGEHTLFEERAHERSIVFHIARHLAARVRSGCQGGRSTSTMTGGTELISPK